MLGVSYKVEEAAFLAGYLAGKMSKSNVAGFIAGDNKESSLRYYYGFKAGLRYAAPGSELMKGVAGTFTDSSRIEEMAQRMGVSRKTAWKDLHNARKKIADAVINGKALHMESCGSADDCECRFEMLKGECTTKKCYRRQHGAETGDDTLP
jgi:basic membrane lipoprotein Med (substrate-binding protein (PBP1-ABC) superfamily)